MPFPGTQKSRYILMLRRADFVDWAPRLLRAGLGARFYSRTHQPVVPIAISINTTKKQIASVNIIIIYR